MFKLSQIIHKNRLFVGIKRINHLEFEKYCMLLCSSEQDAYIKKYKEEF